MVQCYYGLLSTISLAFTVKAGLILTQTAVLSNADASLYLESPVVSFSDASMAMPLTVFPACLLSGPSPPLLSLPSCPLPSPPSQGAMLLVVPLPLLS